MSLSREFFLTHHPKGLSLAIQTAKIYLGSAWLASLQDLFTALDKRKVLCFVSCQSLAVQSIFLLCHRCLCYCNSFKASSCWHACSLIIPVWKVFLIHTKWYQLLLTCFQRKHFHTFVPRLSCVVGGAPASISAFLLNISFDWYISKGCQACYELSSALSPALTELLLKQLILNVVLEG